MIKRLSTFAIYLLLATLPLQSIAAANLPLIKGMFQSELQAAASEMPCHEHMAAAEMPTHSKQAPDSQHACKDSCMALCMSFSSFSMISPGADLSAPFSHSIQIGSIETEYVSVISPNLFRPPISLS